MINVYVCVTARKYLPQSTPSLLQHLELEGKAPTRTLILEQNICILEVGVYNKGKVKILYFLS